MGNLINTYIQNRHRYAKAYLLEQGLEGNIMYAHHVPCRVCSCVWDAWCTSHALLLAMRPCAGWHSEGSRLLKPSAEKRCFFRDGGKRMGQKKGLRASCCGVHAIDIPQYLPCHLDDSVSRYDVRGELCLRKVVLEDRHGHLEQFRKGGRGNRRQADRPPPPPPKKTRPDLSLEAT